jgi:MtN3 and saliva related transmembrane protein
VAARGTRRARGLTDMISTIVGALAAPASVISFAPQAWRIIKTRKTDELATMMWVLNVVGFSLWTIYGVERGLWVVIVPNSLCLAFAVFILTMKLVSRPTRHAIADVLDPAVDADAARRAGKDARPAS